MTTSDTMSGYEQPPASGRRLLRRTRTDRVAAGVSSGLGDYFGVDPVLFRVLFATSAFFGGAGILAYLLAWAAIPDEGTERAPIDGWIAALRRRRFPGMGRRHRRRAHPVGRRLQLGAARTVLAG